MKAMILAAGLGTRLKPFTDNHPKALAVVNGKTIAAKKYRISCTGLALQRLLLTCIISPNEIIDYLKNNNNFGSKITISDESDEVLETGGGLKKAGWFFKE